MCTNATNAGDPGVKKLTVENWQQCDEAAVIWRQMTRVAKTPDDWAKFFLAPTLCPSVPVELAKLFEVARAAMMCSWYYYPLAMLGMEQCWRLLESAVRMRCGKAGIPTRKVSKSGKGIETGLKENVAALIAINLIPAKDAPRWEALRGLRNDASHPKRRSICDPGEAGDMLGFVAQELNALFR